MKHKEQILKLRADGKTYKEICDELGCSKSTVGYHCGEGQKEKNQQRQRALRKENVLLKKVDNFKHPSANRHNRRKENVNSNSVKLMRHKADDFQRRDGNKLGERNIEFSYHDILEIYGEQTECYLTGRLIDLRQPRTYNFDHKVPAAKGGDNSLQNLGICTREANNGKSDLMVEEFIQLCKEVLEHNGYEIKHRREADNG